MLKLEEVPYQGSRQPVSKVLSLNFVLLCVANFCSGVSFQSLVAGLPIYIKYMGGSTGNAGLALASLTVAAVIIRPFTGVALDTYGRKLIFVSGLLVFLAPSLIYSFLVPIVVLLILRFIQGFGWGIINTSAGTIAADFIPISRLGEGLGIFNLTGSISMALGPLMSLWLIDRFSFRVLFVVCSFLGLSAVILALLIKYPGHKQHRQEPGVEFRPMKALRPAMVVFLTAITQGAMVSFLPLFARDQSISNPGIFFTFYGISSVVFRPVSGRIVDRFGQRGYDLVIVLGIPITIAALWMISLTTTLFYLAISGIIYGIGLGLISNGMMALCFRSLPQNRRGVANAIYGTALDTGVALGSAVWGGIAAVFGFTTMFQLTIVPYVLAFLVYFGSKRR